MKQLIPREKSNFIFENILRKLRTNPKEVKSISPSVIDSHINNKILAMNSISSVIHNAKVSSQKYK